MTSQRARSDSGGKINPGNLQVPGKCGAAMIMRLGDDGLKQVCLLPLGHEPVTKEGVEADGAQIWHEGALFTWCEEL